MQLLRHGQHVHNGLPNGKKRRQLLRFSVYGEAVVCGCPYTIDFEGNGMP
eukprot:m.678579 g.678579  ORF g.678579 m.678579 type:complete len:50 (-) comp22806_c0_seq2:474-623(-)